MWRRSAQWAKGEPAAWANPWTKTHVRPTPEGRSNLEGVVSLSGSITEPRMAAKRAFRQRGTQLAAVAPIYGDRVQLQQVILNLILNAIQAMGDNEPRDLLIETREKDGRNILVSVFDSGPGLDPATVDRIFEPFYSTKQGGMGKGLSICRSIIEVHEGKIWAQQNNPRGSTFQFTLPVANMPIETSGHSANAARSRSVRS